MVLEDKLSNMIPEDGTMYFSASWCGPCQTIKPVINKMVDEGYNIVKVDADENPEVVEYFGVMSIPTFVRIKEGREDTRAQGALNEDSLKKFME